MIIYIFIFAQKLIENILSAFRSLVYTNGHKHIGALITIINTIIWITAISLVLTDITSNPIKIIIYGLGQALGNYIGILIEENMNIGDTIIYMITDKSNEEKFIDILSNNNIGLTVLDSKGVNGDLKSLFLIIIKRKTKKKFERIARQIDKSVLIIEKRPTNYIGGYVLG